MINKEIKFKRLFTSKPKIKDIEEIMKGARLDYKTYVEEANYLTSLRNKPIYAHVFPWYLNEH